MQPTNVSTHTLVCTTIEIHVAQREPAESPHTAVKPRIKWDRVDIDQYKEIFCERIETFLDMDGDQLPNEVALQRLTEIMVSTAEECTQSKPKPKNRNQKYWPPDIIMQCREAKSAFKAWKDSGASKQSAQYMHLREVKKNVRRAQSQHAAGKHRNNIEKLMEAEKYSQNAFFKLIKQQRSNKNRDTPYILLGKGKYEGEHRLW